MSTAGHKAGPRSVLAGVGVATGSALRQLGSGLGTGFLALLVLLLCLLATLTSIVGVGLLLVPPALRALHAVAHRERVRLSHRGPELLGPADPPTRLRAAAADPTTRREVSWLVWHATVGTALGLIGVLLPVYAVRDLSFPLWWQLLPPGEASSGLGFLRVNSWPGVFAVSSLGLAWTAVLFGLTPAMARLQAWPGRRLLAPDPGTDLSLRIAELTATRAAALDAHAHELRRIERSLHDGTQNRLVAAAVLLGTARRMLHRDPTAAEAVLDRAQSAVEEALAELRAVARGILPPLLTDRGLAEALAGLAASCPVPCHTSIDLPRRCAASVEATAYFVVAEALTNVARHSGARQASVSARDGPGQLSLRITDDGRGGADESAGTGLSGIRRRVDAQDGTVDVTSPPGGPTIVTVELPCGS